jgi:hypothetical protein
MGREQKQNPHRKVSSIKEELKLHDIDPLRILMPDLYPHIVIFLGEDIGL